MCVCGWWGGGSGGGGGGGGGGSLGTLYIYMNDKIMSNVWHGGSAYVFPLMSLC